MRGVFIGVGGPAEQQDEWAESGAAWGLDVLSKSRADQSSPTEQEANPAALTA
jgi:putative transposase